MRQRRRTGADTSEGLVRPDGDGAESPSVSEAPKPNRGQDRSRARMGGQRELTAVALPVRGDRVRRRAWPRPLAGSQGARPTSERRARIIARGNRCRTVDLRPDAPVRPKNESAEGFVDTGADLIARAAELAAEHEDTRLAALPTLYRCQSVPPPGEFTPWVGLVSLRSCVAVRWWL